ncbi:MAG: DUF4383 domain-containing protein [Armatimonadota bacterium]|nr:DUF4383 domain-containing protein [Armatimonadota bacterium]MDR5697199.1 DUF4383 domain-containing protein [Armatimonadota bacterium]
MAKTYAQVVGVVLIVVGLLGFIASDLLASLLGAAPSLVHNVIHLATGLIGAYIGFSAVSAARSFAQVFGVIYALVALLGFVAPATLVGIGIEVTAMYNVIHLVIALWGLWAGFSRQPAVA